MKYKKKVKWLKDKQHDGISREKISKLQPLDLVPLKLDNLC